MRNVIELMMLALLLQTQVPIFQAPVLKPNEVFAYASRAELASAAVVVTNDHKLVMTQSISSRNGASASNRKVTRELTNAEWKSLTGLLTPASWATLPYTKKKNPMWPSCYDGADYIMLGRIGKEVKVWGNDKFEGSITEPYMSWVRQVLQPQKGKFTD